jgi:DNA-binding NarL/FixJ family response regulator
MTDVYIVDDHKLVVECLAMMIDGSGKARVAGKYYNLASCRSAFTSESNGILLLDVELPDGDGVDFCIEAAARYPNLKIVMLTCYKEFNIAKHALLGGARGYVLKNADPEEIFAAVETVDSGGKFLCEEIDLLLEEKKNDPVIWLTDREKEILRHTAAGLTARETAEKIKRGTEVVRLYRKNLLLKFGAKNMAELIRRGYEMNLI